MKTVYKIFLAKLAYRLIMPIRALFGKGQIAKVRRGGVCWELDLREGIDFAIYLQGRFEPQTAKALDRLVQPGQTILDIGANIGAHTLGLAKRVGDRGQVIAFEPTQYAYSKLLNNISLNPDLVDRIVPEQIMLGREDIANYQAAVYSSWTIVGDAERHPKHLGELKTTDGCSLRQLDSYLAERGNPKIHLVKMDVDGYECEVLYGAAQMLERDRPVICFELAPYVLEERGASIDELIKIMAEYNYRIFRESNRKALPMLGTQLRDLVGDGAGINAIAISV